MLTIGEILGRAAATEIMPRFRTLAHDEVRQKSSAFDLVTDADEAAERAISAGLDASFPDALATAGLSFIVDPIDGTRNCVAVLPLVGVMAAAAVRGEIVGGVIHDPV